MKIPKSIDKLLQRRTKLAIELAEACYQIDTWLEKKGFDLNESPLANGVNDNVMIYCEPKEAEQIVRECIMRE